jgi:hypothetical protein
LKMPHIEVKVFLPVKLQSPHSCSTGTRLGLGSRLRRSYSPSKPYFLVALPPPPHGPIANVNDLSRFPPLQACRPWLSRSLLAFSSPAPLLRTKQ